MALALSASAATAEPAAPVRVNNTGLTLPEGSWITIDTTALRHDDEQPSTSVAYQVTQPPANGRIEIAGATGLSVVSFNQAQVDANLVRYAHDDSDTEDDFFDFDVQDGLGNSLDGERFAFIITPVDDSPPTETNNTGSTASEGGTDTISGAELRHDDSEQGPTNISYTVTTPPAHGRLEVLGDPGNTIGGFTRTQIDSNQVRYVHDDSETEEDSFDFEVDDGIGNILSGQRFDIDITPVDDTPPTETSNTGSTATEGGADTIEGSELRHDDSEQPDTSISYNVTAGPTHGHLEIVGDAGNSVSGFTRTQVDAGQVRYVHDGTETEDDFFDFEVDDGLANLLTGQRFLLAITPVDDDPPTETNNTGSSTTEGGSDTITGAELRHDDSEQPASGLSYSVTAAPGHGRLELSNDPGNAITGFTRTQLDANEVRYVHDDTETENDSFDFEVDDGVGNILESQSFAIVITLVDDTPPTEFWNTGSSVAEGDTDVIRGTELRHVDSEQPPTSIVYTVTSPPEHGQLELVSDPGNSISSFTRIQLDSFQVIYAHDGSDTEDDSFEFHVDDGVGNLLQGQSFALSITPVDDSPPTETHNTGSTVSEGDMDTITGAELRHDDSEQPNSSIVYTVTLAPAHGRLELVGDAGNSISTFTRTQLDTNQVRYVHDDSDTEEDHFDFEVDDGLGNILSGQRFDFTITPVDEEAPTETNNTGSSLDEGDTDTLTGAELRHDDSEQPATSISYTVTRPPAHGRLELSTDPGNSVGSFTRPQVDANQVRYVHDDTDTETDSFDFEVDDGVGNVLGGQSFAFAITLVDDTAPVELNNAGSETSEGWTDTLSAVELRHDDAEQPPSSISYTVTDPPDHGRLELSGDPGNSIGTFTRTQVDASQVRYVHDGSETEDDSFDFEVDDGVGNRLTGQTFAIEITPVNDDPVASAGGPYETTEGLGIRLTASASDAENDDLSYSWDIDDDDVFGDRLGRVQNLSWAQLKSFGLDDDGSYAIKVQVDDETTGRDVATTTLTVLNARPSLTPSGSASITEGQEYSLSVSASDPGDDTITSWTVNWGDGSVDTFSGVPVAASHTYDIVSAAFNILLSATDEDGTHIQNELVVTDSLGSGLLRYDAGGEFVQEFATGQGLDEPRAVIVGPAGRLVAAGRDSDKVARYDSVTGAFLDMMVPPGSGGLDQVDGLAYSPAGDLLVASHRTDNVLRYDGQDGDFIEALSSSESGGMDGPGPMTVRKDGNLYVTSHHTDEVYRYDATNGTFLDVFVSEGSGGLDSPEDLAFGPDGHLYIASSGSHRVLKFHGTTGASLGTFVSWRSGGLSKPTGLEFGPDGDLYVASSETDSVLRYDGTSGAYRGAFVTPGTGGLNRPYLMTFVPTHQIEVRDDTPPVVSTNSPAIVFEGEVVTVGAPDLRVDDTWQPADEVTVRVTTPPEHGQLEFTDDPGQEITNFSQEQLEAGLVVYAHDDSDTTDDSFEFELDDGQGHVVTDVEHLFVIILLDDTSPELWTNSALGLLEGATVPLTADVLEYRDSEQPPENLVFNVTTPPEHGQLEFADEPGDATTRFTQADVYADRVVYVHDDTDTTSDGFIFDVDDSEGNALPLQSFSFNITPVDDEAPTRVTNTGSTTLSSVADTILSSELHYEDSEQGAADVLFTLTASPVHGRLESSDAPGLARDTFTQEEIDAGTLAYVHDGSPAVSDSFDFVVSDGQGNFLPDQSFVFAIQHAGLSMTPGEVVLLAPGSTAIMDHQVGNHGDATFRSSVTVSSTCALPLTLWSDPDLNGTPDDYLGLDVNGDGIFDVEDELTALGDSDGNGILDTGLLAPAGSWGLVVEQPLVAADCTPSTVTIHVEADHDPDISLSAVNVLHVGTVSVAPDRAGESLPGEDSWLSHTLFNASEVDWRVDLDALSTYGWPISFHVDPNADADPADASPALSDTTGSGRADLLVEAGEVVALLVRTEVPVAANPGLVETTLVRALVGDKAMSSATDTITVGMPSGGGSITEGRTTSVEPGGTVRHLHRVDNTAPRPNRIQLIGISSCGLDIVYHGDLNHDGQPDVYLGTDAGGDGLFHLPEDDLSLAGDSDGDRRLDTGLLAIGGSLDLIVEQTFPDTSCTPSRLDLAVDGDGAFNVVHVGRITVAPDQETAAIAGEAFVLQHVLHNETGIAQLVDIDAVSGFGWDYAFDLVDDADGGQTTIALTDTDGSGLVDLTLEAHASAQLVVRALVPQDAGVGLVETMLLRLIVDDVTRDLVEDRITVTSPVSIIPEHVLSTGDGLREGPGRSAYFPHRVINERSAPAAYRITAESDQGWLTRLVSDPNGDGRPDDGEVVPWTTSLIPADGGTLDVLIRVDVPASAQPGEHSQIDVGVQAVESGLQLASARDDLSVSLLRLYDGPDHVRNVNTVTPCSTLHALVTGLDPMQAGVRFLWRSPSGIIVRTADTIADGDGTCADSNVLGQGQVGSGWTAELQIDEGFGHATVDAAEYAVVDPLHVEAARTLSPTYDALETLLEATASLVNPSFLLSPEDLSLRWLVLSPDRSRYLTASGIFAPRAGGEATGLLTVDSAPRLSTRVVDLRVDEVSFIEEGIHILELHASPACGPEQLMASGTFEVLDDEDHDGLSREAELDAGTDPGDADSDDDGLTDGADGLDDHDSDGVIDALDCDSDDDGLNDGLEAGIAIPHEDSLASPCLVLDAEPGSVTDPDDPDSDGGGVSDGEEDENGNGRVDHGERDPNDPSDDGDACSPELPPELADLRVGRHGNDVRVSWLDVEDRCTTYRLLSSGALPGLTLNVAGLGTAEHVDTVPLGSSGIRYYVAAADSSLSGEGPTGH